MASSMHFSALFQQLDQAFSGNRSLNRRSHHRYYSDEGASGSIATMPEHTFHKLADHTLDDLFERIETFIDDMDMPDSDIEYSQGVLTIRLGDLGTYVINKQTPNRQIWMSSPVSGPVRYDYQQGHWIYHRDGHMMHARLETELTQLTGEEVDLNPCSTCEKLNACVDGKYCLTTNFSGQAIEQVKNMEDRNS